MNCTLVVAPPVRRPPTGESVLRPTSDGGCAVVRGTLDVMGGSWLDHGHGDGESLVARDWRVAGGGCSVGSRLGELELPVEQGGHRGARRCGVDRVGGDGVCDSRDVVPEFGSSDVAFGVVEHVAAEESAEDPVTSLTTSTSTSTVPPGHRFLRRRCPCRRRSRPWRIAPRWSMRRVPVAGRRRGPRQAWFGVEHGRAGDRRFRGRRATRTRPHRCRTRVRAFPSQVGSVPTTDDNDSSGSGSGGDADNSGSGRSGGDDDRADDDPSDDQPTHDDLDD